MKKKDKLLPVSIVADRLGLCKQSVYNLICTGGLSAVRIGPKCAIRILESDLRNFIEKRTHEAEIENDEYLKEISQNSQNFKTQEVSTDSFK